MTNYSQMSDFEINKRVAIATGHKCYYGNGSYTNDGINVTVKGNGRIGWFNCCREADTAWPIIVDSRIGLSPSGDIWHAYAPDEDLVCSISNPLRAAMIVFLMMKDAENANS